MSVALSQYRKSPDTGVIYPTTTETAQVVRGALKSAFPAVKFSVRSDSYSGGSSIRVGWVDGPTDAAVQAVVGQYQGSSFDGMIDLKSTVTSTVTDEDGAEQRVRWGPDWVFTNRELSDEFVAEILATLEAKLGSSLPTDKKVWWNTPVALRVSKTDGELFHMVETETESLDSVVRQYAWTRSR